MSTKKALASIILISLCLSFSISPSYSDNETNAEKEYIVSNVHKVILTQIPGVESKNVIIIPKGKNGVLLAGPVIADNMTWWKVEYEGKRIGWVHDVLLDLTGYKVNIAHLDDFSYSVQEEKKEYFLASPSPLQLLRGKQIFKTDFREAKPTNNYPTYVPKSALLGTSSKAKMKTVYFDSGVRIKHISFGIPRKIEIVQPKDVFVVE